MNLHSLRAGIAPVLAGMLVFTTAPALAGGSHSGGHGASGIGEPGKAAQASRTIEVVMGDAYFEPPKISVMKGETIRFVIRNKGAIVHEFNIGTPKMHAEHQREMMMMVEHGVIMGDRIDHAKMKMDMGNGMTMQHDDPNSVLLEPGKSADVVWKFSEAIELEFACNVPGHYDAGMAGSFEFVEKLASN